MVKSLKTTWKLVLFLLLCLFIALLINMPVNRVLEQASIPANIKITLLAGTLFKGQASELRFNGFPVRQLEYQADLSCLLTARLCYRFEFDNGEAHLGYSPFTNLIEITGLDVEVPVADLNAMSQQMLVSPSGSLQLKTDKLMIRQGKLTDIDAIAVWKNAGITGEDFELGDYQLRINKDSKQYRFSLQDNDAVLDIDGKGSLSSNGNYSLNVDIKAQAGLDSRIKNVLELIARKKGLNQYTINRSGQLDGRVTGFLSTDGQDQ